MSSLWTPSGEHPVDDEAPGSPDGGPLGPESEEQAALEVEELRRQLAATPASVVIANHCYGLFELAAVYLSQMPPVLDEAKVAIDALGALVEGLGPRLGDVEPQLRDALAQVRLAFVELDAIERARDDPDGPTPPNGAEVTPGA
jgi:hypothetical protein